MKWERIPLGPMQTNSYLLVNDQKEGIIIDPGSEGKKLIQHIQQKNIKPLAILLTHTHFDHIGAVDDVRDHWSIPVYVHRKENDWLSNPEYNGSIKFGMNTITAREADELLSEEGPLTIGDFSFMVYHTPGHSPGSVSYYHKESGLVFSGDALFAGSIGRTDLYGGNQEQLLKSIHDKLLTLPEDTVVLSGHGTETTIEWEMERNPFLNGF